MAGIVSITRAVYVAEFGAPTVLGFRDVATPDPKHDEVLVKVTAAAVTPLDTYLRSGLKVGNYAPVLPYVPGYSLSGVVRAVGSGVNGAKPGSRVFGYAMHGAYATEALCKNSRVFPLPDHVNVQAGALVAVPYKTAYHALFDLARAQGGETVLVQGAGGSVGAATVQLSRMHGLHVIATCSKSHEAQARADGAHAVIDFRAPRWTNGVRDVADGRPIDMVVEVAARTNLAADMDLAAPGGRIVIVGGHGETPIDPLPMIAKGLGLYGVSLPNIPPSRDTQIMAAIVAGLELGVLRPRVSLTFPFQDVIAAHEAIEAGRGSGGVALVMEE